ncbi:MAG: zinc dependent phospholipase C family protein [Eggerthellaceae bacterium]|nr:zinc dependent phospholipase C family protein [Eggerthellaceae bacterium]
MPAIISHHLFGEEAYEALAPVVGESATARDAFLLGNQGPDPLFCLKALPSSVGFRSTGTTMHAKRPDVLLAAFHRHYIARSDENAPLKAFACGFLCHYLLDSIAHPLVYAQQYAVCAGGIEGLPPERSGREVHALIETDLDEYLLLQKRGETVETFVPHRETLRCNADVLRAISAAMAPVTQDAYGIGLHANAFATSVLMYRAAQTALDSKRDGLRSRLDYAHVLAGPAYLHVQALTHTGDPRDTPFANNDHIAWAHPFKPGEIVSASFDELYDDALSHALALIPQFAQPGFARAQCEAIANGINFYGQPVG